MDKEIFEAILKKSITDSEIKHIIDMKWELALPKGENYTSTILKVIMKVVLGNGRIAKKSFIAKKEKAISNFSNNLNLFNTEVSVYTNVLREMDYLMEEFGDTEGPLWCQFIHYSQSDPTIIMEDLKASGFTTVKRPQMQDLEHARLVLRSLGRYHAMSKVLEVRGLISKDDYKPYPFLNDEIYIRSLIYGGRKALVKGMKAAWGEEWAEYADKLSQMPFEEYLKRMKNCGYFDEDTFKCLNHGDCWNNNIMFKHDWEGRPIELRFVDFQIPHYHSPCVDVTFFMYSSIKPSVRRQNYKSLVELYHESLTSSLIKFGYEGCSPSLADVNYSMERLTYFGLSFLTGCFSCNLTSRTDTLDLDLIFKTHGEEGINISAYSEIGLIEMIGEEVKRIVKLQES